MLRRGIAIRRKCCYISVKITKKSLRILFIGMVGKRVLIRVIIINVNLILYTIIQLYI